MGHSVEKQAIPVEFFEQIRTDEKSFRTATRAIKGRGSPSCAEEG